jgi:hypothetical protein
MFDVNGLGTAHRPATCSLGAQFFRDYFSGRLMAAIGLHPTVGLHPKSDLYLETIVLWTRSRTPMINRRGLALTDSETIEAANTEMVQLNELTGGQGGGR